MSRSKATEIPVIVFPSNITKNNLLESLRIDLRGRGVDVTIIAPGFVRTKVGKKKKSRPFRVELEPATRLMHRAIVCREPYYAFPKTLVALLWLAGMLPASIYDRALAGRGPESGGRGSDPPIAEAVAHIWLDRPD